MGVPQRSGVPLLGQGVESHPVVPLEKALQAPSKTAGVSEPEGGPLFTRQRQERDERASSWADRQSAAITSNPRGMQGNVSPETWDAVKNLKPDDKVTIHRLISASDPSQLISPGDWVALNHEYFDQWAGKNRDESTKVISQTVPARDIKYPGADYDAFIYAPASKKALHTPQEFTMYHGSPEGKIGQYMPDENGLVWVTPDAEYAKQYAYATQRSKAFAGFKPTVNKVKVSAAKIFDLDSLPDELPANVENAIDSEWGLDKFDDGEINVSKLGESKDVIDALRAAGYDAIKGRVQTRDGMIHEMAVLSPKQIKPALKK